MFAGAQMGKYVAKGAEFAVACCDDDDDDRNDGDPNVYVWTNWKH